MEKFEGTVKLVKDYMYDTRYGWNYTTNHIYKFIGEDEKVYVWKTSNILSHDEVVGETLRSTFPTIGSKIHIKASIKGEGEYRGEPQINLTRVKVLEIVEMALTKEEKKQLRAAEQMATLKGGDFVYQMPYKQYKEHYSDCETLAGSYTDSEFDGYNRRWIPSTIGVIVREGRLKNSGVRFQKFNTYRFKCETPEGKKLIQCRYAVNEENARKRVEKDYPNYDWIFDGITDYDYMR